MKQRSPVAVFFLTLLTFGIYGIVWQVKTKNEMNKLGAEIPTAWLIIVPFVSIYWLWKYSEGVEKVTNGSLSAVLAFVLQFLLGIIGASIIQNDFNKLSGLAVGGAPGAMPVPQPDASFGGPVSPSAPVSSFSPTPPSAPGATMPIAPPAPADPIEPTYAQPPQQQ